MAPDRQREINACRIQEGPLVKGDSCYLHSWVDKQLLEKMLEMGAAGSYGGVEVKQTARE